MKEALKSTLVLVIWIVVWLAGTIGGAVLQARLIDIGVLSDIDPPWIITIGSSFIGFIAGAFGSACVAPILQVHCTFRAYVVEGLPQ
jgi:hypothetical protein